MARFRGMNEVTDEVVAKKLVKEGICTPGLNIEESDNIPCNAYCPQSNACNAGEEAKQSGGPSPENPELFAGTYKKACEDFSKIINKPYPMWSDGGTCATESKEYVYTLGKTEFEKALAQLINRYCKENESNTPDFILAEYLSFCLSAFDSTVCAREKWYGRKVFRY